MFLPHRAEMLIARIVAIRLGAVSLPLFTASGLRPLNIACAIRAVVPDAGGLGRVACVGPGITQASPAAPVDMSAEDPTMMIHTSGTTGAPERVLHAHRFLFGDPPAVVGFPRFGDVGWTPADGAWFGGLMDLPMPCLWFGAPLVSKQFVKIEAEAEAAWRLMAGQG